MFLPKYLVTFCFDVSGASWELCFFYNAQELKLILGDYGTIEFGFGALDVVDQDSCFFKLFHS